MDKQYHFFLWTKKECPFCNKAIEDLIDEDLPHTVYEMDDEPDALQQLKNRFDWQTVPMIIAQCSDGATTFVGGSTDLETFMEEKELLECWERDIDPEEEEEYYD
jgi:glutaredoxin